jgi:uncharacterized membrane protein
MRKTLFKHLHFCIFFLLLAFTTAESATFKVTGVTPKDSLNMRSEPHPQSLIVTKVPSDAKGLLLLSDINNANKSWCKVKYQNHTGWVNRKFITEDSGVFFGEDLQCLGTEPFWNVTIQNDKLIFNNPVNEKQVFTITKMSQSQNTTNRWFIEAENTNKVKLQVFLIESSCSDGMSDNNYKYELLLHRSQTGQTINGCCNKVK